MVLTMGGHLIPSFLLKKEITAFPFARAGIWDCAGKKAVIQYQLDGNTGIITRRSFVKFLKYGFMTVFYLSKLFFRYGKVSSEYVRRKEEITSFEFWKRHLGIE